MSHPHRKPLKAFWQAVERRLNACSSDKLRTILRAMAWETPPLERQAFLKKLERSEEATLATRQEDLLIDIDDLVCELEGAMENADAWEERYERGEYFDEKDSLGPYEEFIEPLPALFDRAESAFDYGPLALARTAYQKLFEVLNTVDDLWTRRASLRPDRC